MQLIDDDFGRQAAPLCPTPLDVTKLIGSIVDMLFGPANPFVTANRLNKPERVSCAP